MAMRVTDEMLRDRPVKKSTNASLTYYVPGRAQPYVHTLWVMTLGQTFGVSGMRAQSRRTAHWYPGAMQIGTLSVTGRERDQAGAQYLANFIRRHHESMISLPGTRFSSQSTTKGNKMLMKLQVPSEDMYVEGWIGNFTRNNRGVHEVAPEFKFEFTVINDRLTAGDPTVSVQIRDAYSGAKTLKYEEIFTINNEPTVAPGGGDMDTGRERRGGR